MNTKRLLSASTPARSPRSAASATLAALAIVIPVTLALAPVCASAAVDDFENASLSGWLYATNGGISTVNVQPHNGSLMAFVSHTGWGSPFISTTNSSSLTRDFSYSASDMLSFDMHASATTASGNPSGTKHSGSGVRVDFRNAFNVALGSAGLYNYTNPALLGTNEFLVDNTQHNYRASMADFALLAGLDPLSPITKISLTFLSWGQFSGGGNIYPNVGATANVWFDNVSVGAVPEPSSYALVLTGMAVIVLCAQRDSRRLRVRRPTAF